MRTGILFLLFICSIAGFAQKNQVTGKVTYVSSQLIYVQFDNTRGIEANDTLYIQSSPQHLQPVLIVKYISTRSLACEPFVNVSLQPGAVIQGFAKELPAIVLPSGVDSVTTVTPPVLIKKTIVNKDITHVRGRFNVQSSSDFASDSRYNSNRYRSTVNLTIDNMFTPGLSFSNYMTYSVRDKEWATFKSTPFKNLRVYDAAVIYTHDTVYKWTAGRHLNYRLSGIGTMDGVQFEVQKNPVSYGIAIGSRPEFADYGVNMKLFQIGAYVTQQQKLHDGEYENTVAVFNQTNNFKTDRRFLYFQHTNTLLPKTYLYVSNELDLYEVKNNKAKTTARLTGLYVMARYTPFRELSAGISYDARRNVFYYETYKSLTENMFTNTLRQGVRLSLTGRPMQQLTVGFNSGYRFQKGDPKPSQDYGTYVYYNNLPFIETDVSGNFSYINSAYLKGGTADISFTKNFFNGLYTQAGYRLFQSTYAATKMVYNQSTIYGSVSYPLTGFLTLSANYEGLIESTGNSQRLFIDISTRF